MVHAGRVLSEDQIRGFHEDGYVRLPGALGLDEVENMADRLWHRLGRKGALRDDPSTWRQDAATKLQTIRRGDTPPSDIPRLKAALDHFFGADEYDPPADWGQALATFPVRDEWELPTRPWHLDYSYRFPRDAIWGMNLFLLVADVESHGGATLVVKSSNRLIDQFVQDVNGLDTKKQKVLRHQFDARYDWFRDLSSIDDGDPAERIARFMDEDTRIDGVDVRVVELTGAAGDVILCHPWTIHNGSPNVLESPRLMRAGRVYNRGYKASRR